MQPPVTDWSACAGLAGKVPMQKSCQRDGANTCDDQRLSSHMIQILGKGVFLCFTRTHLWHGSNPETSPPMLSRGLAEP